jgi:hypothetical protein
VNVEAEPGRRDGRRGSIAAMVALVVAAAALGWFGPEVAGALPDQSEPMVTVDIVGRSFLSETNGVRHLAMTADVANLGSGPVQLIRMATEVPALTTVGAFTAGQSLPARSVTRIALTARLDCGTATPLRLPPLELRDAAGTTFRRAVTGSSQQLIPPCQPAIVDGPQTGLRLVDFRTSGDQLVLSLATFDRQPLRLLAVAGGGLPLATPTPVMLGPTLEQLVRLDPAPTCSAEWAVAGPSGLLELTLDWGPAPPDSADGESDPFRVEVQTGTLGADWLMRHSCREWVR